MNSYVTEISKYESKLSSGMKWHLISTIYDLWGKETENTCGKYEPNYRIDADGKATNEAASSPSNVQEVVANPHHYASLLPHAGYRKKDKKLKQG